MFPKGSAMTKRVSRRQFLRHALATAVIALPVAAIAKPPPKASKASVRYQDHPKGREMCGRCRFFLPAVGHSNGMMMQGMKANGTMAIGHCTRVVGRISPMAYCILFTPRVHQAQ